MLDNLNRFWQISVHDRYDGTVDCRTHYLDLWYEMVTSVIVTSQTYQVEEVNIEMIRTPQGKEQTIKKQFDTLKGASAFKFLKKVLEATSEDQSGLWAGTIMESLKSMNQAIHFIWEREKIDPLPFYPLMEPFFRNSCIYFTTTDLREGIFNPPSLQEQKRGDLLFSRYRYSFLEGQNGKHRVTTGLCDSHHEMAITLELENNKVMSSNARILRAPYELCSKALKKADTLQGKSLSNISSEWEKDLQGPEGCLHLADVARECASSMEYWGKLKQNRKTGSNEIRSVTLD